MNSVPGSTTDSRSKDYFYVAVGLVCLLVPLILQYSTEPSHGIQYILKVIVALGAAFLAAAIPGSLEVNIPLFARGAGAIGIFVIVFYFYPQLAGLTDTLADDDQVVQFAEDVVLPETENDVNETQWGTVPGAENFKSIIGAWKTRWRYDQNENNCWWSGHGEIRRDDEWFLIEFTDVTGQYLIKAREDQSGGRLVGRYWGKFNRDTSPWVGKIVNHRRIDGLWKYGRMDLRR